MLIRPDLEAIPFAPMADEHFEKLEKALSAGAQIQRARFRYYGSPRPFEPKIDFSVESNGATQTITVLYGPKSRALIRSQSLSVEQG